MAVRILAASDPKLLAAMEQFQRDLEAVARAKGEALQARRAASPDTPVE
jgi:hypothetical protein